VSWRTRIVVLLVWSVGIVAVWLIAGEVLNPGVSDEDIRECVEEGIFPPRECEEVLEDLESEEPEPIGVGVVLVVWAVGLLLLWLLTRPVQNRKPD
jgi:hypothetical protein